MVWRTRREWVNLKLHTNRVMHIRAFWRLSFVLKPRLKIFFFVFCLINHDKFLIFLFFRPLHNGSFTNTQTAKLAVLIECTFDVSRFFYRKYSILHMLLLKNATRHSKQGTGHIVISSVERSLQIYNNTNFISFLPF